MVRKREVETGYLIDIEPITVNRSNRSQQNKRLSRRKLIAIIVQQYVIARVIEPT